MPAIDSLNLLIPSFILAFTVSCLRREQEFKERDNLNSLTDKNKETIIINTAVNPNIIETTGGAVTAFVRLVQDVI